MHTWYSVAIKTPCFNICNAVRSEHNNEQKALNKLEGNCAHAQFGYVHAIKAQKNLVQNLLRLKNNSLIFDMDAKQFEKEILCS